mgnify:FL=1|jgi:hypothetical protein
MEQNLENQYLDYASWKKTNEKLIDFLIKKNSKIIARFRYVLMVVDYLFDKVVYERMKLSIEEEEVFEVGYQYIFDRFNTIQLVAEHVFNNNYDAMEHFAKSINLLFYILDFEDEIDSLEGDHKEEHKRFADLEDNVMQMIEAKIQVPDEYYALVDDISLAVFDGLGVNYYGITDIFYDVAIELGLIEESDDDYYDIFEGLN